MKSIASLEGKVAIITGSSRGIGRGIAENMARAGARVVISSRKPDACEATAAAIRAEGHEAVAIPASISKSEDQQRLVAETRKQLGAIDILVCNAATNPYFGPITGLTREVFEKVMNNNVWSQIELANLVYPDMKAKKDGAVILISSGGGFRGVPGIAAYNISKAAEMSLARSLAVEWGEDNIRVNCIAVGLIETDLSRSMMPSLELRRKVASRSALGRIGTPDDVGGFCTMLASAAGAFVTGQTIGVDAGSLIAAKGVNA